MDHLTLAPFLPENALRKTIMKIVSDSTPVEDAKVADGDTTFQIFSAIAGAEDARTLELRRKYEAQGIGFGYGHAKQMLFELILEELGESRRRREELAGDLGYVEGFLKEGAGAAGQTLSDVVTRAKTAVGLIEG